MNRLLLIDPVRSVPYQMRTVHEHAVDESAAHVLRVAEGLAQRGHRVTVAQKGRLWPSRSPGGVAYVPLAYDAGLGHLPKADAVVVVQQHKVLPKVRRAYPDARLALWLHAAPGSRQRQLGAMTAQTGATVVALSDAHRGRIAAFLSRGRDARGECAAALARVHPPVDDDVRPDGTIVDPDKLLLAPGGCVAEALATFERIRRRRPTARLYLLGAKTGPSRLPPGVVPLGSLPHRHELRHVREAFALLATHTPPDAAFPLAWAEANAVGTPVLALAEDPAFEVLGETAAGCCQQVPAGDPDAVAERLAAWWANGRPLVAGQPRFRLSRVLDDWERLLGLRARTVQRVARLYPDVIPVTAAAA